MSRLTFVLAAALLLSPQCRPDDSTGSGDLNSLSLEQLMQVKVEGAALHPQSLEDAPASVTVITAEEIAKYGYRTIGEALASVRGFYVSNNRSYETLGVRGFNLPGDYSSHILVMVNGHNMADNIFDYMLFFGNDFPIDMNLIKQIEIIRGPASALYGSNAMFATINIITKSPEEAGPLALTADTGSFGEKKGQLVDTASFGDAKLLFSGSVFNNTGQSPLYFPQFNAAQDNFGTAIDMNGEKGVHLFSTLTWRNWSAVAVFSGHDHVQPVSWGPTIFNDPGTQSNDRRDFVEALYSRKMLKGEFRWRTYYDAYRYLGRFDLALGDAVEDNRAQYLGDWVGTQFTYRVPTFVGDVTASAETNIDIRNRQMSFDVSPVPVMYLNTDNPDRSFAFVLQDEMQISKHWKLDVGGRFDHSSYRHSFLSPRAALNYQRGPWTYKFLYGRSFRNPSAFQLFENDGLTAEANPLARPESADTGEIDIERKLGRRMNLQISGYGYRLTDFLLGVFLPNGLIQYQNSGEIRAAGVEIELNGRPLDWLEFTASYARQRAYDDTVLENSPQDLAKLRFAVPLGRKFDFSSGMQYESSRFTLASAFVKPVYLADFTLSSKHLSPSFDLRIGLRNAFNQTYADPVALNPMVDSMVQPGRSFFVELIAHRAR
jgi:iron complex outermembrane receptor protein